MTAKKCLTCILAGAFLAIPAGSATRHQDQLRQPASPSTPRTNIVRPEVRTQTTAPAARMKRSRMARSAASATAAQPGDNILSPVRETTVQCGEANVSGLAQFTVEGENNEKFVLKQGSIVRTGRIVTHTTGNYTAVALRFDEFTLSQVDPTTPQAKTVSFRLVKAPSGSYSLEGIDGQHGNCKIQDIGTRWPPRP
jgi:hypothetical protein